MPSAAIPDSELISEGPPTSINPYETLQIPSSSSAGEIKTAYKKLALRLHPDKAKPEERESAHRAFQDLAFAYAVLGDERRRKRYDATGSTAESVDLDNDSFDWADFFRAQFAELVTVEKMDAFKTEYQGSEEERADVLKWYTKCKGNMGKLYDNVMLSNPLDDEARFRAYIDGAIAKDEAESFSTYARESQKSIDKRMKKAGREAKEAEKHAETLGIGKAASSGAADGKKRGGGKKGKNEESLNDLAAMIQQRHASKSKNFLDDLEAKYAGKGSKKRLAVDDEPPEEAFAATAKRYKRNTAKNKVVESSDEDEEEDVEEDDEVKAKSSRKRGKTGASGRGAKAKKKATKSR